MKMFWLCADFATASQDALAHMAVRLCFHIWVAKLQIFFYFIKNCTYFLLCVKREADFIVVTNLPETQRIFLPLIKNTAIVNVQQNLCRVERKLGSMSFCVGNVSFR